MSEEKEHEEAVICICADDSDYEEGIDEDHHDQEEEDDYDYESTEEEAIEWFIGDLRLPESEIFYAYADDLDEEFEEIENHGQEDSNKEDPAEEGSSEEEDPIEEEDDCCYITDEGLDGSPNYRILRPSAVRFWPKLLAKHSASVNSETQEKEENYDLDLEEEEGEEHAVETYDDEETLSSDDYYATEEEEEVEEKETRGEKRHGMFSAGDDDSEADEEAEDHRESKRIRLIEA